MSLQLPTGALDEVEKRLWVAQCALLMVLTAGILVQLALVRIAAARMAARVVAAIPEPAAVDAWLREAVGDPDLTVAFLRDDGARIDADGNDVIGDDRRPGVLLTREGVTLADIRSACRSSQELDLVRACVRSSGLALEHVAARARLRAEAKETVAVRARIVATRDRERRRLERNLHDGAQQHLVALGVSLASLSRSYADTDVAAHQKQLDAALAELRTVARGLFPASLGEAGIVPALRELGDHTSAALVVRDDLACELALPTGMAIYQLVLDASRLGPHGSVLRVALEDDDGRSARVAVTLELPPGEDGRPVDLALSSGQPLIHAQDRFVALGGRLDHTVGPGMLRWEGVAPCG
jgi:signal transduction histidine kinase